MSVNSSELPELAVTEYCGNCRLKKQLGKFMDSGLVHGRWKDKPWRLSLIPYGVIVDARLKMAESA